MATYRTRTTPINYRYLSDTNAAVVAADLFEINESDLWESDSSEFKPKRSFSKPKPARRTTETITKDAAVKPSSLPMNVPDWSKILKEEYKENNRWRSDFNDDVDDDVEEEEGRLPPHEFLARTRVASLSVQEGIGRTLKGRDLSRVRNAVWEKIGFLD
ncbi:hypothetical protein Droror1_Dr00017369 [Drosera rotundifolia]